ncbi:MAG: DEAD/DEAH box helicase, partial [Candidatus Micrarchaeota archaeon]
MKFSDLKLSGRTIKSINAFGYVTPTEVQEKTIDQIVSGTNLMVRSQTGTGKTAAFGIGLIERISEGKTKKALVLVPTRELAVQVCTELRGLGHVSQVKTYAVFGGASIMLQMKDIRKQHEILVATPGRLVDLFKRGKVNLAEFDAIVLDEADHMLDLGFKKEVLWILNKLQSNRLTLLFSATIDGSIRAIADRYLPNSKLVEIGEMKVVSTIKEEKVEAPFTEKFAKLRDVLNENSGKRIMVFVRTKRGVMAIKEKLDNKGHIGVGMIQGNMPQSGRLRVLEKFKEGKLSILIATNVASRGLHIDNVDLIINYDRAEDKETHLHRVGRTGR